MKKKYAKMLVYGLVTVMLMSTLSGCSGCKDKDKDEVVTSEIVSEETTEELTEDVSEEVSETVSEETSAETSEEVSEEVLEETTEEVSEETSVETSETPSEEVSEEPAYTVEPMSATMYAQRSVNVRKGPGTEYDRVGSLTTNQEVAVTGKASTGWYEISYNGEVAYVSNNYLGNEKVVVQSTPAHTTPSTPETTTPTTPATPDAGTGGSTATTETTYTVYLEPGMLDLVNGHRTANGVPALTWNSAKEQEAKDRIKAIAQSGQLSHAGMPGSAENLTYVLGYGDTNTFYNNYFNSPAHNANMLKYDTNGTSHSMVSATCAVSAGGFNSYYNVIIIYIDYPDNFTTIVW